MLEISKTRRDICTCGGRLQGITRADQRINSRFIMHFFGTRMLAIVSIQRGQRYRNSAESQELKKATDHLDSANWRTPILDMQNIEGSKFDYKNNLSCKRKHFETLKIKSIHEMAALKSSRMASRRILCTKRVMIRYRSSLDKYRCFKRGRIA